MMVHLNESEISTLASGLIALQAAATSKIEALMKKLADAESGVKSDGTPKKRPGRPLGRKNNKKPVVKKVAPILKEAA